jgi:hypothetical protein
MKVKRRRLQDLAATARNVGRNAASVGTRSALLSIADELDAITAEPEPKRVRLEWNIHETRADAAAMYVDPKHLLRWLKDNAAGDSLQDASAEVLHAYVRVNGLPYEIGTGEPEEEWFDLAVLTDQDDALAGQDSDPEVAQKPVGSRACPCGEADYGAPGHEGHTESEGTNAAE